MNKRKYTYATYLVVFILFIICIMVTLDYVDDPIKFHQENDFSKEWELSIEGTDEIRIIDLPYITNDNKPENIIRIQKRLPDSGLYDPYLLVESIQQEFIIYIDQEIFYTFDSMRENNRGKTGGRTYLLVDLPKDSLGKVLTIEIVSSFQRTSGEIAEVKIGSREQLISSLYLKSSLLFLIAIILLLAAIFMLCIKNNIKELKLIMNVNYLSAIVASIAVWIVRESHFYIFLYNNYALIYFIWLWLLYVFPILVYRFIRLEYDPKPRKLMQCIYVLHVIIATIIVIAQLFGWFTLYEAHDSFIIIFIFTFSITIGVLIKNYKHNKRLKSVIIILAILFISMIIDTVLYFFKVYMFRFCLLGIVLIEIYIICILCKMFFSAQKAKYQNKYLQMQLEYQLRYYSNIDKNNREMKAFRHDIRNHLNTIDNMIKAGNIDLLERYLIDMGIRLSKSNERIIETGNPILDAILTEKINEAKEKEIIITDDIFISQQIKINNLDWSIIFGNLLDNAIEACMLIEEPEKRNIKIKLRYNNNMLACKIINTINPRISIDRELKTSKVDLEYHGFGIENVKKSIEKYEGHLDITINKDTFEVAFVLLDV